MEHRFLAPLDVDVTRIVYCARKPAGQVKLLGLNVVHVLAFSSHCASAHCLRITLVSPRLVFITNSFYGGYDSFLSPIDICNSHCPERNQIDSRHELGNERWQKFPVPAKKINQHGSNTDIQYIISGRFRSPDE